MPKPSPPSHASLFDDDEEEGWQDMPVIREDDFANGLDEEDRKKYHYVPSTTQSQRTTAANATGNLIDFDDQGQEWREKREQNESEYTRLRGTEEDDSDEVHLRTKYLFDEDKAMTPLGQMQTTKNLLTEAQRIAYVGLCGLTIREMSDRLMSAGRMELKAAKANLDLWGLKIMGRLYYHMELAKEEQKMIESLALHGVQAMDLAPALMTTHTVANPEYDPEEARKQKEEQPSIREGEVKEEEEPAAAAAGVTQIKDTSDAQSISGKTLVDESLSDVVVKTHSKKPSSHQTTARVLAETTATVPGITTTLSAADKDVTLDIRWTVLCDLFLVLVADSVYDARSRVLLESVATKLGLGWVDVIKFECRVTEALEIQESVETLEHKELVLQHQKKQKKKRYMMLGLATIGGGLVIGLSAGLLAPVIGAGLGAAFTTIGITGTTGFLAGTGGAAIITTGGVLTGSGIAARGMANRTRLVRTFNILPLYNNKRVSCILTVPGFMNGAQDDVRLPFSVLDPGVGDVFSVLWEPEMIRETGSALRILTGEVLSQVSMTVLQATVMTTLMSALQWPVILTKLGYLIDNPWNNALDRSKKAGLVLADVLIQRHLGVRPITLIGFSLGARVIFYALIELARQKAFGIVQDVFLLGATLSSSLTTWCEVRSVVSGRLVSCYARNDWVLNYLFRATSGGVGTVAGLRPIKDVPGIENIDVTDKISGHMSYRTFLPLILDQLGFPVTSDYFDEPEQPDFEGDRVVVKDEEEQKKKGWFFSKKKAKSEAQNASRPPTVSSKDSTTSSSAKGEDGDLPPRVDETATSTPEGVTDSDDIHGASTPTPARESKELDSKLPIHAGFDFDAIKQLIDNTRDESVDAKNKTGAAISQGNMPTIPYKPSPTHRSVSMPPQTNMDEQKRKTSSAAVEDRLASFFKQSAALNEEDTKTVQGEQSGVGVPNIKTPTRPTLHDSLPNTPKVSNFGPPTTRNVGSVWDSASPSIPAFRSTSAVPLTNSTPVSPLARNNPFASSATAQGLSFGDNAGSITVGSLGFSSGGDPWSAFAAPEDGASLGNGDRKKQTAPSPLVSNPWS